MDRSHPYVKRIVETAQRIVRANGDIEQFKGVEWKVSIFDEPGLANAMVDANGQIIVFKGKNFDLYFICSRVNKIYFY